MMAPTDGGTASGMDRVGDHMAVGTRGSVAPPCTRIAQGADDGPSRLHHCDAQTLLADSAAVADESVSLILTDPPYLISRQTGFTQGGDSRFAISMDFGAWDRDGGFSLDELDGVVGAFGRVLRPGGAVVVFFDTWKLAALAGMLECHGFEAVAMIEWVKTNPPPINAGRAFLSNAREVALAALKPSRPGDRGPVFHGTNFTGTFHCARAQGRDRMHPTQKPVALFEELIAIHSDPGDLVLDCFAGAATTAAAAIRTGRRFVGCERDAQYFTLGAARLERVAASLNPAAGSAHA